MRNSEEVVFYPGSFDPDSIWFPLGSEIGVPQFDGSMAYDLAVHVSRVPSRILCVDSTYIHDLRDSVLCGEKSMSAVINDDPVDRHSVQARLLFSLAMNFPIQIQECDFGLCMDGRGSEG